MKRIFIILFIISSTLLNGQMLNDWYNTFGGGHADEGRDVQQTSDNGYIIIGNTISYGAGYSDSWLIKTDSLGNEEWNKPIGGNSNDFGYSVQQTSDGGYIFVGKTSSSGSGGFDVWLVKRNSFGNSQWSRTFGGSSHDWGKSVQQTTDGGYIILGNSGSSIWLIKTDSLGSSQWTQSFGGAFDDDGYSVQQTTDGGYIVMGDTESFGNDNGIWLIKTDSTGTEEWNQTKSKIST